MSEDWDAVASAINTRMEQLSLSQSGLVNRSGVSAATLRKLQRNYPGGKPRTRTLEDVSRALGWPPGHLTQVLNGQGSAIPDTDPEAEVAALRAEVAELRSRVEAIESTSSQPG